MAKTHIPSAAKLPTSIILKLEHERVNEHVLLRDYRKRMRLGGLRHIFNRQFARTNCTLNIRQDTKTLIIQESAASTISDNSKNQYVIVLK